MRLSLKKIIFMLLFVFIFIPILVYLTTYGWRPTPGYHVELSADEKASLERMERTVRFLSEDLGLRSYTNYPQLEQSADYIIESFKELGYTVKVLPYEANGQVFRNIEAYRDGVQDGEDIIVIGAHYDSCFNPGADDNASGIAGLLEIARLTYRQDFSHHIKFVAFVNEEPPFFHSPKMGSFVYVRDSLSEGEQVKAAIVLEMIGFYSQKPFSQKYLVFLGPFFPNRGNFISMVSNFSSKDLLNEFFKGFKAGSTFPVEKLVAWEKIPGVYFSDHWSFWAAGIPAIMVTDTAFLRNKNYHQKTDLPDTLDFKRMTKVVYGLKDAIIHYDRIMK